MPGRVAIAFVALGAGALLMLVAGLVGIYHSDETLVGDLAALLGIAELVTLGRLVQRNQIARVVATSLCLAQTLLGVIALVQGLEIGLPMIALAAFVVVPLSSECGGSDAVSSGVGSSAGGAGAYWSPA